MSLNVEQFHCSLGVSWKILWNMAGGMNERMKNCERICCHFDDSVSGVE